MALSRRTFLFSTASLPILSEGALAAWAAGPIPAGAPQPIVRISSNENPYGPWPAACEAVTRAAPNGSRYPNEQRTRLVARLAKLHDVDPGMIVLGNGSGEILKMAAQAFLSPARSLVVSDPAYEALPRSAPMLGAEIRKIALTPGDFRHDLQKMAMKGAGLIYVCNPNNPTASLTPKKEVDELVANLPSGAVALVDEAYCHYADPAEFESAVKHVAAGKDVIVARTFSKIFGMAGMRVGYAVARRELAERLHHFGMEQNMNCLGLEAALTSLDAPDLVPRNRERNAQVRRLVTEWLDRNHLACSPTHTNFVFFDTGRAVQPQIAALRDRGVMVGRPFPPLTNWMRVTIGTEDEMKRFMREYDGVRGYLPSGA